VTENLASPRPSCRAHRRLITTLLLVAVAALGCDATDPAPGGLRQVRSGAGHFLAGVRGGPFDTHRAAVGRLDPDLLDAIQEAAHDAEKDGVTLVLNSGWRSRAHQQRLFDEAVSRYGSEEEARRWVSTPDTSAHVAGDAVDIGPTDGAQWLGEHGAAYGLCQIFANEIWHFELATTPGGDCPDLLPDSGSRG
jgi:D-alanyl-D-alanine carboxypeptidase